MTDRTIVRPVRPCFPLWGWLGVWIAAGLVVLTTLVVFLLGIVGDLESIDGSLSDTAKALIGTSSSLVDTASVLKGLSGSLADTSNVLNTVRTVGGQILDVLEHTQSNPDQLGTENLWMRADQTLPIRAAAEHDTASIVGGITDVNKHLKSVCNRIPLPPSC